MPVKTIIHPTTKQTFKFGCNPPIAHSPHLRIENYLMRRPLLTPPKEITWVPNAMQSLNQVYLNNTEGDCVIAGNAHKLGVFTGNSTGGNPLLLTGGNINNLYHAIGGFVPGVPSTDNGCDPETALNFLTQNGFFPHAPQPHKYAGWMTANAQDLDEVKITLWLFETVGIAMCLPDAWISPPPSASGFVWGINGQPDPRNGHYFIGMGYDQAGNIPISTWGMVGTFTPQALATYPTMADQGALYVVLTPDVINRAKQKAPNGLDWTQLEADFQALGGTLGYPAVANPRAN